MENATFDVISISPTLDWYSGCRHCNTYMEKKKICYILIAQYVIPHSRYGRLDGTYFDWLSPRFIPWITLGGL